MRRLLGFGSAAGISDESYTDHIHKTYRGRCLAVIRSGYDIGEGRITAKSKSYGESSVRLDVRKEA